MLTPQKFQIAVSTQSALKLGAIRQALLEVFGDEWQERFEVLPVKLEKEQSDGLLGDRGVPEQPLGENEIMQGVNNGNRKLREYADFNAVMGIESGLIEMEGEFFDKTYVALETGDKKIASWSENFPMPRDAVEKSIAVDRTVVVAEFIEGISPEFYKDPYFFLSQGTISRQEIIKKTLIEIFQGLEI